MSSCLMLKSSALALGIGTIAQVPVPEALTTYREYGVIGLLILAVIGLWLDATRKEREAQIRRDEREKREEAYRQERDRKDDERTDKFVAAIEQVNRSIVESQAKCGMNQYLLDQLKKPGL